MVASPWIEIAGGLATFVPPLEWLRRRRAQTGGTISARYCYTVWLRHLVCAHRSGLPTNPEVVAELGPGDSIGTGLAALLTGARRYYAVDAVPFARLPANLAILDELVGMFRRKADLPGDEEFPRVWPRLDSYAFPVDVLDDERLASALDSERIKRLRAAVEGTDDTDEIITYAAPCSDLSVVPAGSVDTVLSQAVLQYSEDLEAIYLATHRWLKPEGWCSHTIGFQTHVVTPDAWNGHWSYSDFAWKLARGKRDCYVNRQPRSAHLAGAKAAGFEVVREIVRVRDDGLPREKLAKRWRSCSDDDLRTEGIFIQLRPGSPDPDTRSTPQRGWLGT